MGTPNEKILLEQILAALGGGAGEAVAAVTAVIANGEALSAAVDLAGGLVAALQLPGTWTTAAITFQASIDGGATYGDVYDDGVERSIASASVVASRILALDVEDWRGFTHLKIRSGTVASPVNQGGARTIVVATRRGV